MKVLMLGIGLGSVIIVLHSVTYILHNSINISGGHEVNKIENMYQGK